MTIEAVTYYRAVCDVCGIDITAECGEYAAWSADDVAATEVIDGDGYAHDGLVICHGCFWPYKAGLSDEDWDALADNKLPQVQALTTWAVAAHAKAAQ